VSGAVFGLGTIGIGKPWGYADPFVPGEAGARELLDAAWRLGVRYIDTAPSYGVAEERLGRFLDSLTAAERGTLTIATKFGEHWDDTRGEPFVDHSYEALVRSLDGSIERLGRIDYLQLHKTTPEVLQSDALARAWEYARSAGVTRIGASVSDAMSAELTVADPAMTVIQAPYNFVQTDFTDVLGRADGRGMWVAVNRPFGMGRLLYERQEVSRQDAFGFVLAGGFAGVVLSGTKSASHLEQNWRAFAAANEGR
jgi:aryl-alcohol dehydrogenase-like predicted oxidoreductase